MEHVYTDHDCGATDFFQSRRIHSDPASRDPTRAPANKMRPRSAASVAGSGARQPRQRGRERISAVLGSDKGGQAVDAADDASVGKGSPALHA
jgi:hypothetical protein